MISESWWPIDSEFQPLRNQKVTTVMLVDSAGAAIGTGIQHSLGWEDQDARFGPRWRTADPSPVGGAGPRRDVTAQRSSAPIVVAQPSSAQLTQSGHAIDRHQ